MTELRCDSCKFFEEMLDYNHLHDGFCRKYAPRPLHWHNVKTDNPRDLAWPAVLADDWCGEWSQKE
jgi:hypothetical protein